jgi:hypothetical protein
MAHLISQRLGQGRRKLQRGSEGFLMMAGILAALGMVLGTVALVNLNLSRWLRPLEWCKSRGL